MAVGRMISQSVWPWPRGRSAESGSCGRHPYNTDLSTACGERNSISVREVLDVGSGDTYSQYRPGQSFDITGLANGTYCIQVIANPEKRLQETNLANNTSLRKVVLGGTPGARTVTVPPYDLIDAPWRVRRAVRHHGAPGSGAPAGPRGTDGKPRDVLTCTWRSGFMGALPCSF
jgi:hypothetical protein